MFARFLELTIKPEKKFEMMRKIKEEIVPILKKNTGFFDLIPLEVETEPTKFYALSLWHEKTDLEKYHRDYFPKVKQILDPFMTAPMVVKVCNVETTIPEKFITVAA